MDKLWIIEMLAMVKEELGNLKSIIRDLKERLLRLNLDPNKENLNLLFFEIKNELADLKKDRDIKKEVIHVLEKKLELI